MRAAPVVDDHGRASGHFAVGDHGQPHMTRAVAVCGLPVEEHGDTVFAEAAVGLTRDQVAPIAPQDLADVPSPPTAMAHTMALLAKDARVSHFSLSTLK